MRGNKETLCHFVPATWRTNSNQSKCIGYDVVGTKLTTAVIKTGGRMSGIVTARCP